MAIILLESGFGVTVGALAEVLAAVVVVMLLLVQPRLYQ